MLYLVLSEDVDSPPTELRLANAAYDNADYQVKCPVEPSGSSAGPETRYLYFTYKRARFLFLKPLKGGQ